MAHFGNSFCQTFRDVEVHLCGAFYSDPFTSDIIKIPSRNNGLYMILISHTFYEWIKNTGYLTEIDRNRIENFIEGLMAFGMSKVIDFDPWFIYSEDHSEDCRLNDLVLFETTRDNYYLAVRLELLNSVLEEAESSFILSKPLQKKIFSITGKIIDTSQMTTYYHERFGVSYNEPLLYLKEWDLNPNIIEVFLKHNNEYLFGIGNNPNEWYK